MNPAMAETTADRAYFLVKDPHWTFLFWEISSETAARVAAGAVSSPPEEACVRLRIHDVTDILFDGSNSHAHFDIEARGLSGHWYLEVPAPGRVYCAEIGFESDEMFVPVVRTEPAFVPTDRPSDRTEGAWSRVERPPVSSAGEPAGYLLIVLNTHQPFVRHPEFARSFEESWLFEAITECYLPLSEMCEGLLRDGIDARLTLSLTPCLIAMLEDGLRQERYVQYLEDRISLLEREVIRLRGEERLARVARMHHRRMVRCLRLFDRVWQRRIVSAFRELDDHGIIHAVTSAATHAYLPLWEIYPGFVELQMQLGIEQHARVFGRRPTTFWLPECGFTPGLDGLLRKSGVEVTFVNAHGVLNGDMRPKYGTYAPVRTPNGISVFAQDLLSHGQVCIKEVGYPGDPMYLDFRSDIGYDLPPEQLRPASYAGERLPIGIRYHRSGPGGTREPYDPEAAYARCAQHASHFVRLLHERVASLSASLGTKPVIVALFDTEFFGHWWQEGPTWLDLVIRKLAHENRKIRMVTAEEYLSLHPVSQVQSPSMSSWGWGDYSETWLMGDNHWIYPELYRAIDAYHALAAAETLLAGPRRAAMNQYLREILLAQSSDWAFMIHARSMQSYAEQRVRGHLEAMQGIRKQLEHGAVDPAWLGTLERRDNLFAGADLVGLYEKIVSPARG